MDNVEGGDLAADTRTISESWRDHLARQPTATAWLQLQANLRLADRTVDAYGRGLADYLAHCERRQVDPVTAQRADVALWVRDLTSRPHRRGANVVALDSGAGLANATLQQRLVAVRLFYDYLVEEGLREVNPVGRGRYTAGKSFGGHRERGLLPRFRTLPWIPTDEQWREFLEVARSEPIRNRLMLALAYDAGLRREELCLVRSDDFDPAHRTVRIRAETTKGGRERITPYSASTGALLRAYLATGVHSVRLEVRCSCRSPITTAHSRSRRGRGRRWSGHLPCERICRVSARIRCATSA